MKVIKIILPLLIVSLIFQRCQENELEETYFIDRSNSVLQWHESNEKGSQLISFDMEADNIKVTKGRIKTGTIIFPLASIRNSAQVEGQNALVIHQSDTLSYPNVILEIKSVELLSGIHPKAIKDANWWIRADLSMQGQTHQVSFPAKIKFRVNDMELEAKFSLDPKKWGMELDKDLSNNKSVAGIADLHMKAKASISKKALI